DQYPHPVHIRDAARRIQAFGLRQGSVHVRLRGLHTDQARHAPLGMIISSAGPSSWRAGTMTHATEQATPARTGPDQVPAIELVGVAKEFVSHGEIITAVSQINLAIAPGEF